MLKLTIVSALLPIVHGLGSVVVRNFHCNYGLTYEDDIGESTSATIQPNGWLQTQFDSDPSNNTLLFDAWPVDTADKKKRSAAGFVHSKRITSGLMAFTVTLENDGTTVSYGFVQPQTYDNFRNGGYQYQLRSLAPNAGVCTSLDCTGVQASSDYNVVFSGCWQEGDDDTADVTDIQNPEGFTIGEGEGGVEDEGGDEGTDDSQEGEGGEGSEDESGGDDSEPTEEAPQTDYPEQAQPTVYSQEPAPVDSSTEQPAPTEYSQEPEQPTPESTSIFTPSPSYSAAPAPSSSSSSSSSSTSEASSYTVSSAPASPTSSSQAQASSTPVVIVAPSPSSSSSSFSSSSAPSTTAPTTSASAIPPPATNGTSVAPPVAPPAITTGAASTTSVSTFAAVVAALVAAAIL